MSKFEIQGKTALITGANRGIGRAFLDFLLEMGAENVYAGVRSSGSYNELKTAYDSRVTPLMLDVTDQSQVRDLGGNIKQLDILVNNAGIANQSLTGQSDIVAVARQEMETNFFGALAVTQQMLPKLLESSQAAIINVSSIAGISSFPGMSAYSASKAALHSMTQALRIELSASPVQVIGVYPGPTDTRLAAGFDGPKGTTRNVAKCAFEALDSNTLNVLPDEFAQSMYQSFLKHPHELENVFAGFYSAG